MSGKIPKEKLIDYFYGELGEEERLEIARLLETNKECRKFLEELELTSGFMQKWDVPEQKMNFVFVQEKVSLLDRIRETLPSFGFLKKRPVASFGYAFAGIFLLLSFTNFSVSYDSGGFSLSASVFGTEQSQDTVESEAATQQLIQQQQRVMLEMVEQLIRDRENHQQEMFTSALVNLTQTWDQQRKQDLNSVSRYLTQITDQTDKEMSKFSETMFELLTAQGIEIKKDDF